MLTGPVGAGKTVVANEVATLLRERRQPHALVDLAVIGTCWPAPLDDPWHELLSHRNLACMWGNFAAAGAQRLILCRVLENRSLLRRVEAAVPGADITLVRLRAPLQVLHDRLRRREAGDPSWFLDAATALHTSMEQAGLADHVVDNAARPVGEVAQEVLRVAGWRPPPTGSG
jgi:chloramphenicol 3-O-phosphotransferase